MFQGVYTAIVTPFRADGSVDYECLKALVARQRDAGVAGIVPVGTTGESPSLSYEEHIKVIETVVEACGVGKVCCKDRPMVIAGTGANSTSEALELTRQAKSVGADATLQVTPYYNKPSQEGLYRHFMEVAEKGGLPVMLYNVPGRTSKEIDVETVARLASHEMVVAIKEAAGSVDRVSRILDVCELTVLSGDDALTLPMMSVGATGVVSVASNVIPKVMRELVVAALAGRWDEARTLHKCYYRVMNGFFLDTNPVPVKTALAMLGLCEETFRLPLCPMEPAVRDRLRDILDKSGVV
jgi:4-hydroxy-tetrahydrodipicolinate synthase